MVQSSELATQPEPQKIELNNPFMPFEQLKDPKVKIPQTHQSPVFELEGVGKVVYRFSDILPNQPRLDSQVYVWAEMALDTNLATEEVEGLITDINLKFIRGYGEQHLGNGEINVQGDRITFNRFVEIMGQEDHRIILPDKAKSKPFAIKKSEIHTLKSVIADTRKIRTPNN